jgi:sarcosine oxidase subunit beta
MPGRIVTRAEAPQGADLVVVGGGIVGAATAFFASRAGLDVVVVEARGGLATLTTTRSLEAFRAQFEDPEDIAMMRESIDVFERFAEVVGLPGYDISLHQQGYLFVTQAEDGEARVRARVEKQRAGGLHDVELLSGDEARRRFPYLAPDVGAAAFRGRDGWLASHEATYGFALGSGALFLLETEVLGFEGEGRLQGVRTSRGIIATPRAVVAAGPFSGRVAGLAGLAIPFGAVRRHRAGIKAHPFIPRHAPMTVSLDTGAHWRPEGPGAYLGWSAALDERPEEPREDVRPEWTFPALALDAVARFSPFWVEIASNLVHANVTVEAGQYDMTPDAKPLIGAAGGLEGLYLNTGYSGHGVMGAPAGGRMVVDAMLGRLPDDRNPFGLSRFSHPGGIAAKKPL